MHEVSAVADMIAAIRKEIERYDVISVKEVTLTVGRLTNLGREQMEFAYEVMTKDSILEGSRLVIEEEEIEVRCAACGYEGPVNNIDMGDDMHNRIPVLSCPDCGSAVTVTAGKTCCVRTMDIEVAD